MIDFDCHHLAVGTVSTEPSGWMIVVVPLPFGTVIVAPASGEVCRDTGARCPRYDGSEAAGGVGSGASGPRPGCDSIDGSVAAPGRISGASGPAVWSERNDGSAAVGGLRAAAAGGTRGLRSCRGRAGHDRQDTKQGDQPHRETLQQNGSSVVALTPPA